MRDKIYRDVRSGTNILGKEEFHDIIMAISDVATEMVVQTLGPGGATTVIDDGVSICATKDGLHSLESLVFNDPIYNTFFRLLRSASFNSAHKVGDGTTTAMVVSNAFMHALDKLQEDGTLSGYTQTTILKEIKNVAAKIKEAIKSSEDVSVIDRDGDFSDIAKIAYISSNGNDAITNTIKKIYQKTKNPHIHVTTAPEYGVNYEIIQGYRFNCRPLNLKIVANDASGDFKVTDETTFAYIFDHNVNYNEHKAIIPAIINYASALGKTAVIFAPHFDDIMAGILNTNNERLRQMGKMPNVVMVQIPLSTELNRTNVEDMSVLMNCSIFDAGRARVFRSLYLKSKGEDESTKTVEDELIDADGYNFSTPSDIIEACTGRIRTMTIAKDHAIINDYMSIVNLDVYNNHVTAIEKAYNEAMERARLTSTLTAPDVLNIQGRRNRLLGHVGVIRVGAESNLELEVLKDTVDDAVFACKSAYENGTIRGLNLTTLTAILDVVDELEDTGKMDKLTESICNLFTDSFTAASRAVFENMDIDEDSFSEIIENCIDNDMVYDLRNRIYEVKGDWTVINPLNTDLEIVDSVVSMLSTLMTSTQLLSRNRPFDKGMTRTIAQENELALLKETEKARYRARLEVEAEMEAEDTLNE